MRNRRRSVNLGSSSLILIFIVLCLGTFALLSLSSAKKDLDLAERNEQAVAEYYRADGKGEEFLMEADRAFSQALEKHPDNPDAFLRETLGDAWNGERKQAEIQIPMANGQALSIVLGLSWEEGEKQLKVMEWRVVNVEDYEIDQNLPVWDGQ
ncbi:MAG TPA: hypothetical protein IAA51_13725 [Candidatus Cottocaccamicrobium excrementipullorum]|nr:hypothetical protein [Candidatus Cottocaccamicrobium excrementipullorum]